MKQNTIIINPTEKKEWSKPDIKELDLKETKGSIFGALEDVGFKGFFGGGS